MKAWLNYLNIMQKASKHGVFFPKSHGPSPAPLGSQESPTKGNIFRRLRNEVGWFRTSYHRCGIPGLQRKYTILHLTDIHIRDDNQWLQMLCREFNGLRPDIVAITGDITAKGWERKAVERFLQAIPQATLGRYAVLGNWEYWVVESLPDWERLLKSHNIQLLKESWVTHSDLTIAGTDDFLAGTSEPEKLISTLPSKPTVVLSHSPALFPRLCKAPIDLVLSGHAHGGQIRPPLLGAFWVPRGTGQYVNGWYKGGNTNLFVSRGLGWSVAPLRLWCPPEIAWIELIPTQKTQR